jgi:hypothetical protein
VVFKGCNVWDKRGGGSDLDPVPDLTMMIRLFAVPTSVEQSSRQWPDKFIKENAQIKLGVRVL